ncbi:MAG: sugar phosphate isomerase/epimerase [Thermoplasmata archaeon]|nr:sugar phosphate isomerase/epimerase [Thermoplasmata archaeon]
MISIGCPPLSLLPFEEALRMVEGKFDGWEIVAEGKHLLPEIESALEQVMSSHSIKFTVHAPLSDINIGTLNPGVKREAINQLVEVVEIAHRLGIERVTMHPGFLSPITFGRRKLAEEAVRDSVEEIERRTAGTDVVKCIENMPRLFITLFSEPEEMLDLIDGTSFQLCLDVGHANTTDNLSAFLEHWERFGSVHVHDNRGKSDEHLPLGEGEIDFEMVFSMLRDYRGDFVVESRSVEEGLAGKRFIESLQIAAP